MTLAWAALSSAITAWSAYRATDPTDAARRVRQVARHLVLPPGHGGDGAFLPLRLLIAWLQGIPFARQGGRSVNMQDHDLALWGLGLARVDQSSPFFEAIFCRYHDQCLSLGKAPARYAGDDPRNDRVFWVVPG